MRYAILDQGPVGDGSGNKWFKVVFEAEDGYQETQTLIGPTQLTLRKGLREFQRSRDDLVAATSASLTPPVISYTIVASGSVG